MKFPNPWIDPRIVRLGPAEVKDYLVRHGWKSLGPASNPILEMFEGPGEGGRHGGRPGASQMWQTASRHLPKGALRRPS
jgi:hypothetical protein